MAKVTMIGGSNRDVSYVRKKERCPSRYLLSVGYVCQTTREKQKSIYYTMLGKRERTKMKETVMLVRYT